MGGGWGGREGALAYCVRGALFDCVHAHVHLPPHLSLPHTRIMYPPPPHTHVSCTPPHTHTLTHYHVPSPSLFPHVTRIMYSPQHTHIMHPPSPRRVSCTPPPHTSHHISCTLPLTHHITNSPPHKQVMNGWLIPTCVPGSDLLPAAPSPDPHLTLT